MNNDIDYSVAEEIQPDCAVVLESTPEAPSRVVVIESDKARENIGQSHYFQEHPVSKQLIGKKIGDKVTIVDNEYVVKSFVSKYLHLFAHCRDTFSENFPEDQFMWKVKVFDDEGNFDITKMQENLGAQEKRGKQIHENVEKALFPFSAAATLAGKSYLDLIYAYIASRELTLPSSMLQAFPEELPEVVVLDLSVCITLCESGIDLPEIEGVRFVIPASSSKILADKIKELETANGREEDPSFAYTDNGKLRIQESTKEALRDHINVVNKLKKWIKANVEVIPLSKPDALTKQVYDKYEEILGGAWADVITEVKSYDSGAIFISEDLALRRLLMSEDKDIVTANSQQLLDHFRRSGLITTDQYLSHVRYLVESGFKHTYVNADDLHEAFKAGSFKLDDTTEPFIEILTDDSVDAKPVIGVAIQFLYKFWKSPGSQLYWDAVSAKVLQALIKRRDYKANSQLVELVINKVFYMVPNIASELIQAARALESM